MDKLTIIFIVLLICSYFIVFIIGIYLGSLIFSNKSAIEQKPTSFLKSQGKKESKQPSIEIDDTKVVLKIDTDGMEKKFTQLGEKKEINNNISSAVSKLKNMKGK